MACDVERLREELMKSLGIGVERSSPPRQTASFKSSTHSACDQKGDEPGCGYEKGEGGGGGGGGGGRGRGRGGGEGAELDGKIPRRSSGNSNSRTISSSHSDAMMGAREQQQQHTRTSQQDPGGYYNSRTLTGCGGGSFVDKRKRARPASATSRATIGSSRVRPASASSARRPSNGVRPVNDPARKKSKEMDVLLEICRDKGRGFSLDPADFDSSISAICNIPVGPFAGASREGWGKYFRELHGRTRARKTSITAAHNNGGPLPMKRRTAAVTSSPTRVRRRLPPKRRQEENWGHQQRPPPVTIFGRNNSSSGAACPTANTNTNIDQHRNNDPGGLAELRERAAKRAAEENVLWRMAMRLQTLWQELKIPGPDRAYITATCLGGSGSRTTGAAVDAIGGPCAGREKRGNLPTSDEVNLELVRQIRLLLDYRASTIKVLRSVTLRESRLTEVKQALQAFQWHRGRDTDAVGLVAALAGLRGASLGVVRAVVEWRQKLWQPRAFCWRGVNYLEKMSRDTLFLRSPVGRNLLASVGLAVADMTFVLFPSTREDSDDDDNETFGTGSEGQGDEPANVSAPPPIVRLTPKAGLASEYRARFFAQPAAAATAEAGGEEGGFVGDSTDWGKKRREVEVVVQEAALQRRVEAERTRLATKGCFVPLLRWLPAGQSVPYSNPRRTSSSTTPPPADSAQATTNTDSGNDGGTDKNAQMARGHGFPPAASGSTLPIPEKMPSTTATTAESSRGRFVGRSASTTAQELDRPAVDGGEVVFGVSPSVSHGGVLGAHNSIAERDDESETNTPVRAVGQTVEKEEGGGEEESGGKWQGQRAATGSGDLPCSDGPGQKLLRPGEDGNRRESDENSSPFGGDSGGGESRASAQPRPAENIHSGSQTIGSGHLPAEVRGITLENRDEEPREPRLPPEEADEGSEPSTGETRGRSEHDGYTVNTDQLANKAETTGEAATDSADIRRNDRWEALNGRSEAGSPVIDDAAGRGYARQIESGVDGGVLEARPSETANKLGVHESPRDHSAGGSGGDGGSAQRDREGARAGQSVRAEEQCEGSVCPSVMYTADFEDAAEDSSLTRSEGGVASSCREISSPVGGVRSAPMTREKERTEFTQAAEDGSVFSAGGKAISAEAEQERPQQGRQKEHINTAARRIQKLMMRSNYQQGVRGRREEYGKQEEGANDQQAWLAAWRARRETQVRQTETDAAIRIQSTARKKRASDEVHERRRNHATRILDATLKLQAFARRWKEYRREAVQEVGGVRKETARRTVPHTNQEQLTLVGEKKGTNQAPSRQTAKEDPHQSPKNATNSGATSTAGSGQNFSEQGLSSTKQRNLPEKVQGGSSAASSSSKEPTSKNSYSSLTLTSLGGRRFPSSGSEGSSSSGMLGSLNSSHGEGDDIASPSAGSDVAAGGAKKQLGQGGQRKAVGDREENERSIIGPAEALDKIPPSSSGLNEAAAAAGEPTQPQRKEGASAVGTGGKDPRTTAKAGDAFPATDNLVLPSLSQSTDGEEPASEVRQDSVGGPPLSSFSSDPNPPMVIGASTLVALSPVPEEPALSVAAGSVSEYGSDDLNFEALSSSHGDTEIAASVGTEATKRKAPIVGRADVPQTQATGNAGGTESVPNSGRVEGVEGTGEDSDGSLMSLSASSDD